MKGSEVAVLYRPEMTVENTENGIGFSDHNGNMGFRKRPMAELNFTLKVGTVSHRAIW